MNDQRYFVKIKKRTSQVADFFTANKEDFDSEDFPELKQKVSETEHFEWVEYEDVEVRAIKEEIDTIDWRVHIDGQDYGPLENVAIGSVLDRQNQTFLPEIDFGDTDPALYSYDYNSHSWISPIYENGNIYKWSTAEEDYVLFNQDGSIEE